MAYLPYLVLTSVFPRNSAAIAPTPTLCSGSRAATAMVYNTTVAFHC